VYTRQHTDARRSLRIVRFDWSEGNAVEAGDDLYVMLSLAGNEPVMVPATCPHRGGPLHLAELGERRGQAVLICPWHGTAVPVRALYRRQLPLVRTGTMIAVAVHAEDGVPVRIRQLVPRLEPTRSQGATTCHAGIAGATCGRAAEWGNE
jgi:nitrite reductase (NADH) small subunit